MTADPRRREEVVEETGETKLVRNANGALLRYWKDKSGTPEHVDFLVKDREGWEKHIRPGLLDMSLDALRIPWEEYRWHRELCSRNDLFLFWHSINVFECIHPICGHEHMLIGMALDPDWVKDMCTVLADTTLRCQKLLFEREGVPDGIWYFEDMGFKERPFMSPAMYRDIVWPSHKLTFDYAHQIGCPVLVHSCGFVEPLVPDMIEAGMDCLQAIEVKAGMDLLRLKKRFGHQIALCGGLDVRALESNDLQQVEALLQANLPTVMAGGGYIIHTDHSISRRVNYETYQYFRKRALEIGTYS